MPERNRPDTLLKVAVYSAVFVLLLVPEIASAQAVPAANPFSGITSALKAIAQAVIFDWGPYIGMITLGIQGYRWKMGRIDGMHLLHWGLGISIVFFAPNIVAYLKSSSVGTIQ